MPSLHTYILISLLFAAEFATAQEHRATNREIARQLWERELQKAGGKVVEQPHYPTEPALIWLSAWSVLREPKFADAARRQIEYAHTREKHGIIVAINGVT